MLLPAAGLQPRRQGRRNRLRLAGYENVGDDAARNLMARIGQRSLDPPAAPIPVLRGHANDRVFNLIASSGPARATVLAPIALPGDQLPVSGQEGFRRDDCRDFPKNATPGHLRLGRQAPAPIVVQPETLVAELLPQHPVFFAEVIDRVALLPVQTAGDGNHEPSKRVEGPAHWHGIAAKTEVTGSRNRMI